MANQIKKIKLLRLYSDNNIFDPVEFKDGLNIILGEKSDSKTTSGSKTNGVGKTILAQFIDFCLLTDYSSSRVSKIPNDVFPLEENINLDLMIGVDVFKISRNRKNEKTPIITINGQNVSFPNLKQTAQYISNIVFENANLEVAPSLRSLFSILIRDENSEFKDIAKPFDLRLRIPEDFAPHLYLLHISLDQYKVAIENLKNIKSLTEVIGNEKKELTNNNQKDISYVKAELNEVNKEVDIIGKALDEYKTADSYEIIEKEVSELEVEIKRLSSELKVLYFELRKINSMPKVELIPPNEIELLYNSFVKELGTLIVRNLDQVTQFKAKVEVFQRSLLEEKRVDIQKQINILRTMKDQIDTQYSQKMKLLDTKGVFQNLKTTLSLYQEKKNSMLKTQVLLQNYEKHISDRKKLDEDKIRYSNELDNLFSKNIEKIDSFQETILSIHEYIMGNRECSFEIVTNMKSRTNPLAINLRIHDDGSHGIDRIKVFIYDISLLFNEITRNRHPLFLLHDNLFETDQNTRIMSLNYIYEKTIEHADDFQYIVTLNKDYLFMDNTVDENLRFNYEEYVISTYTKESKFLKKTYKEITKNK